MRRRPVPRNVGAASCLAALLLVAGCSQGPVEVDARAPAAQAEDCRSLLDVLPERVAGEVRREVEPASAPAAAWGDPPIVLRCGVGVPQGFDELASCQITNGVAWFIPDEQITGSPVEITMTTIGREPGVEVRLPRDYFPPAAAMVDLAGALKRGTVKVERCG